MKIEVVTRSLPYKGGFVTSTFHVYATGVHVQKEDARWVHASGEQRPEVMKGLKWKPPFIVSAGSVWVPNKELLKRTNGATGYMLLDDIYLALRQCFNVTGRYGRTEAHEGTEKREMEDSVKNGRASSLTFLQYSSLTEDEKRQFRSALDQQSANLATKRDEHKRRSARLFTLALATIDADRIGRPNPGGAAMQCGAGIGELIQRLRRIADIAEIISGRGHVLGRIIETALDAYQRLWSDIVANNGAPASAIVQRLLRQIERSRQAGASPEEQSAAADALERVRSNLMGHAERFRAIQVQPFRSNASYMVDDLRLAVEMCNMNSLPELTRVLGRIKHGVRWIYALSHLQLVLLFPFALRLNYHKVVLHAKNQQIRKSSRTSLAEYLRASSHDFTFMAPEIDIFERKVVEKCRDTGLVDPVKSRVIERVASIKSAIGSADWLAVKDDLQAISAIL